MSPFRVILLASVVVVGCGAVAHDDVETIKVPSKDPRYEASITIYHNGVPESAKANGHGSPRRKVARKRQATLEGVVNHIVELLEKRKKLPQEQRLEEEHLNELRLNKMQQQTKMDSDLRKKAQHLLENVKRERARRRFANSNGRPMRRRRPQIDHHHQPEDIPHPHPHQQMSRRSLKRRRSDPRWGPPVQRQRFQDPSQPQYGPPMTAGRNLESQGQGRESLETQNVVLGPSAYPVGRIRRFDQRIFQPNPHGQNQ